MARMRPDLTNTEIAEIKSAAERRVYRALKFGLPERVLIIHGMPLIKRLRKGRVIDGEADFTIFDPQRGLLVVEVKGGAISYNADEGWTSKDRNGVVHPISDPYWQASTCKHEIVKFVTGSREWKFGDLLAGHAAFFPDIDPGELSHRPNAAREFVGGFRNIDHISDWIDGAFSFWGANGAPSLTREAATVFERILFPKISVPILLGARFREEDEKRLMLTDRQALVLSAARHYQRLLVHGGAGTGKTLLARQRAVELSGEGHRTLYICYNRPLADLVADAVEGAPGLFVFGFHSLCSHMIELARRAKGADLLQDARDQYPGENEYDVQLPFALSLAADLLSNEHFDAIVVDEAQDFGNDYWIPLELLLKPHGNLLIFFDSNQAIYRRTPDFPIKDPPFLLSVNCRNTKAIHDAGYQYYRGDKITASELHGEPVRLITAASLRGQAEKIAALLKELMVGGVSLDEVVILMEPNQKDTLLRTIASFDNKLAKLLLDKPLGTGGVRVVTVKRFKGLDATVAILWGFDDSNELENRQLLYVACTRAKSLLVVVSKYDSLDMALPASELPLT